MSGISQQKGEGGSCRAGCDSLLDNWRALLHHFPCLVSGQLHWDCKPVPFIRETAASGKRHCCSMSSLSLSGDRTGYIFLGEQGGAGSVDGGAQVMVFLCCRESLETIHQENWRSEPRLEPAGGGRNTKPLNVSILQMLIPAPQLLARRCSCTWQGVWSTLARCELQGLKRAWL